MYSPTPRTRAVAKDVTMTTMSLLVMLLTVAAVFMPPTTSLALEVNAESIAGDEAVIYGTVVDDTGRPVRGATVVVVYENGQGPEQIASLRTNADGTFRVVTDGPFGTHRIIVSADVGARVARDSITQNVQAGHAYGVRAELLQRDYFVFIPLGNY